MIAIIILNWNGHKDTIACLHSLQKMSYDDFFVVVGDNGSTDGSLKAIEKDCRESGFFVRSSVNEEDLKPRSILLMNLKENNGFAKGNNILVSYCRQFTPDYYLLLNNDTEVEPDFLEKLVRFHQSYPKYKVLTPLIRYYYDKTKIWNAGGELLWGRRRYFYAGQDVSAIRENDLIPCSFVTGCALFFLPEVLRTGGQLFVENFFFGEEDFELSLRLKKEGIKIACVLGSVIYHKVGASTKERTRNLMKNYIYYLNRYIDMRQNMGRLEFYIWRRINNIYIRHLLVKKGNSQEESSRLIKRLNKEAYALDGVSKDYFESVLKLNEIE